MIAAAGSGERLGAGGSKAFVEVAGRPMLAWSVAAVAASRSVGRLIIAATPGEEAHAGEIAREAAPDLELSVVSGGPTRAESVKAAVGDLTDGIVAIHDVARPLASAELFDAVIAALAADPDAVGAIAAAPVADTVKRAGEGEPAAVTATVDRTDLWAAQTPQAFRVDALRAAQDHAARDRILDQATDEAWLLEREGGAVLLVAGGEPNLKVTTPADLRLAEAVLRRRSGV